MEDRAGQGAAHNNLAATYRKQGELQAAEFHFRQAISSHAALQKELGAENQQWQITLFETQASTYHQLEEVLIAQKEPVKALAIADFGRSRALVDLLGQKLSSQAETSSTSSTQNTQPFKHEPLTPKQMQTLAKTHGTTFLFYSSSYSKEGTLHTWVIPPGGEITFHTLDTAKLLLGEDLGALAPYNPNTNRQDKPRALFSQQFFEEIESLSMENLRDPDFLLQDEIAIPKTPESYQQEVTKAQTPQQLFNAHLNLADGYGIKSQWHQALENGQQAETLSQELDPQAKARASICLAAIQSALKEPSQAFLLSQRALRLLQDQKNREAGHAHREKGSAQESLQQYQEALASYEKALAIAEEIGDFEGKGKAYRALGLLSLKQEEDSNNNSSQQDISSAIATLEKALEIARTIQDPSEKLSELFKIGSGMRRFLGDFSPSGCISLGFSRFSGFRGKETL